MAVTITGDMTKEEINEAMVEDLRAQVASGSATLNISPEQAAVLLELLPATKTKAAPAAKAAAVDDDDDEEDEKPKPKRR